jgi:hypothetical protein
MDIVARQRRVRIRPGRYQVVYRVSYLGMLTNKRFVAKVSLFGSCA